MCLRFVFLLITRVAAWLRLSQREEAWQTAEILILRHQRAVLQRRQPRRPDLHWADRALPATLPGHESTERPSGRIETKAQGPLRVSTQRRKGWPARPAGSHHPGAFCPGRRVGVLDGHPDARLQPGTPRRLGRRHNPDVRVRGCPGTEQRGYRLSEVDAFDVRCGSDVWEAKHAE